MNTTVVLTVISGVLVYVLGQLIVKFVIEPVQETKKLIGYIAHSLIEHANVISNPDVTSKEDKIATSQAIRKLSAELRAQLYLVPKYHVTAFIFRLPSREKMLSATTSLMGLSNGMFGKTTKDYEWNAKRVQNIHSSLGLYISENEGWPEDSK
ncbi:MAG: hypothetical protein LV473_20995 [Nitrospira sp.]|nr:hypothetical protein [Nitrospira sp.]